jgi:hypothetical protein
MCYQDGTPLPSKRHDRVIGLSVTGLATRSVNKSALNSDSDSRAESVDLVYDTRYLVFVHICEKSFACA